MNTTAAQRSQLVNLGKWWVANKGYTQYEEYRPVSFFTSTQFAARNASHDYTDFDCSSSVDELMFMEGGMGDPSGPEYNFNGYGNTQTQYEFLPHLGGGVKTALAGDLIMFDPPPESIAHVCMVLTPDAGGNPLVFNHGEPGEPVETYYLTEVQNHVGQMVTVLSVANLSKVAPPPPPPPDPYHYQWFDNTRMHLPHGINSEANVVKNYDKWRLHPVKNAASLKQNHNNLEYCITRLENNMKATNDPKGTKYHRAWRLVQLKDRAADKQIVK